MSRSSSDDYVRVPLISQIDDPDELDINLEGNVSPKAVNLEQSTPKSARPWSLEFYQSHFDVDTKQVLARLFSALLPNPRRNFIQHILKPQPDLYGPFWIATTLILTAAIGGNVASYLHSRGRVDSWQYDFKKVTLASTIIYAYWWLIPLGIVIFLYIRERNSANRHSSRDTSDQAASLLSFALSDDLDQPQRTGQPNKFIDLLSTYGYSLTVFIPVSILWTIPSAVMQWMLVACATAVSSAFLTFALHPMFRKTQPKLAAPLMIVIVVVHCLFSAALLFILFNVPSVVDPVDNNNNNVSAMNASPAGEDRKLVKPLDPLPKTVGGQRPMPPAVVKEEGFEKKL